MPVAGLAAIESAGSRTRERHAAAMAACAGDEFGVAPAGTTQIARRHGRGGTDEAARGIEQIGEAREDGFYGGDTTFPKGVRRTGQGMTEPSHLFDPELVAAHRRRAAALGEETFLRDLVIDDIEERLREVNRTFRSAVVVGPHADALADRLSDLGIGKVRIVPDAEVLELGREPADLAIHALALHWSNDPVGALIQLRRALRPDGLLIAALFGGETLLELRQSLAIAESEILGGLSPRVAPMAEIRQLGQLLQRAGLALPVADARTLPVAYRDLTHLVGDLRRMGETSSLADRRRLVPPRALFRRAEEIYRAQFRLEEDRISATFEIVFLTGWAPAEGQQKALRPGSALSRLADALGAEEFGPDGETSGGGRDV